MVCRSPIVKRKLQNWILNIDDYYAELGEKFNTPDVINEDSPNLSEDTWKPATELFILNEVLVPFCHRPNQELRA